MYALHNGKGEKLFDLPSFQLNTGKTCKILGFHGDDNEEC
jgi:hypothetical protein